MGYMGISLIIFPKPYSIYLSGTIDVLKTFSVVSSTCKPLAKGLELCFSEGLRTPQDPPSAKLQLKIQAPKPEAETLNPKP